MKYLKSMFLLFMCYASTSLCAVDQQQDASKKNILLSPNEDLTRDHGVLNRILLIYQELARRINNRLPFSHETLSQTITITKEYIENFHEELEEEYVFPYFEKNNIFLGLIKTLKEQHDDGRRIVSYILAHSSEKDLNNETTLMVIAAYMNIFCQMFRPHEARETSDLFPLFPALVSKEEYENLGVLFEKKGNERFGNNWYERIVDKVVEIEKQLGLYELPRFVQ